MNLKWMTNLMALTVAVAVMSACLPLDNDDPPAAPPASVKLDDVYAATMALVGASQLSHVFVTGPDQSFDVDPIAAAQAVEDAVKAGASCVKVTRNDAELTFDFGAGCAPPKSPIAIQGQAVASMSVETGKSISVTLELTDFGTADKRSTGSGTLKVTKAADGADVDLTLQASAGTAQIQGGVHVDLLVDDQGTSFRSLSLSTIDPTTVTVGESTLSMNVDGVTLDAGQCYPGAGSILATVAGVKATLAFTVDTPSTGVAKFTPPLSKKVDDLQLPGLGWTCN